MKNKIVILISVILTFSIFFAACKSFDEPDIIGEVLDIEIGDNMRVLINSDSEIKGEIWVTVNNDTSFVDSAKNKIVKVDNIEDYIIAGEIASILSDGVIMESYPMQTKAIYVYIEID